MAPKPKKELTDAQKAKLKKMLMRSGNLDKPKSNKASTSYSPKPMTAAAKEKIKRAATTKQYKKYGATSVKVGEFYDRKLNVGKPKSKSLASKVGGAAGKVAGRAKTVAREARDIKTAVGSAAQALRKSPQEGMPVKKTIKNIGTQIKETARAAVTGKKGTTAYKVKPTPSSQAKRKAAGGKGFVTYDVTKPKKRK
jgi:hypothetical protein